MPQLPKNYLKTHSNRFLRMIAKARECDKAKGAFVEGLLSYVHKGRIHADINQIRSDQGGTVTEDSLCLILIYSRYLQEDLWVRR